MPSKHKPKGLEQTQVFTPPHITHAMLDLLDPALLAEEEAKFFEPSCGDGQMLDVIVERLYQAMLAANGGDKERALACACVRWFAIEIDSTLVEACRQRLYDALWAKARECDKDKLCQWLLAWLVHQRIACKDFFEFMKETTEPTLPWDEPPRNETV